MSERTVSEKYHDEIVVWAQAEIVKRNKRIERLESALESIANPHIHDNHILTRSHLYAIKEAKLALGEDL